MNPQAIERRLGVTVEHLRRVKSRRPEVLQLFKRSRTAGDPHNHEAMCRAVLRLGGDEEPDGYVAIIDSDFGTVAATTKRYQGPPIDGHPTFEPAEVERLREKPRELVAAACRTKREFPGSKVTP